MISGSLNHRKIAELNLRRDTNAIVIEQVNHSRTSAMDGRVQKQRLSKMTEQAKQMGVNECHKIKTNLPGES